MKLSPMVLMMMMTAVAARADDSSPAVRPAGFEVWGTKIAAKWLPIEIPAGWQRVAYKDDPWRHAGPIHTAPPRVSAEDRRIGYHVFSKNYCDPVMPESTPTDDELRAALSTFASPGEYQPISFCIRPLVDLKDVAIHIGPLRSQAAEIPANHLDLRTVRNLPIPCGRAREAIYALRPTLLESYETTDLPANTTKRFWLTVKVPPQMPPGRYSADIEIRPTNRPAVARSLEIEVLPIKLEDPPTTFGFYHQFSAGWKQYHHRKPETLRQQCVDMAEHGMNGVIFYALPKLTPDGDGVLVDFETPEERHPQSFAAHMRAYKAVSLDRRLIWYSGDLNLTLKPFSLRGGTSKMETAYASVVRQVEKWRKDHQIPTIVYSPDDEIDASLKRSKGGLFYLEFLKRLGVPTFQNYIGLKDHRQASLHAVDLVCFAGDAFRHEFMAETSAANKELWIYSGNARYGLDPKGDRYCYGLFGLATGAAGVMQWAYQWPAAVRGDLDSNPFDMLSVGRRSHDYAFPADDGLLPTIGLEGIREGVDDARYAHTLRQWIKRARMSNKPRAVKLADAAETRLQALLDTIDTNRGNIHYLDDFSGYIRKNQLPCHDQPDAMTGADFQRIRRDWADGIIAISRALK